MGNSEKQEGEEYTSRRARGGRREVFKQAGKKPPTEPLGKVHKSTRAPCIRDAQRPGSFVANGNNRNEEKVGFI